MAELAGPLAHFRSETTKALARPVSIKNSLDPTLDQMAWKLVLGMLPTLEAQCRTAVDPNEQFRPDCWNSVVAASEQLLAGQPCGESVEGATVRARTDAEILNAAFVAKIGSLGDLGKLMGLDATSPSEASQLGAVLDELVLKSFEIAEYRRREPWE